MENKIQLEKEPKEFDPAEDTRAAEIYQQRIERMKKAFRPTWLQDQINSESKNVSAKKA